MDIMVFVCFEGTFTRLFFGIRFSFFRIAAYGGVDESVWIVEFICVFGV